MEIIMTRTSKELKRIARDLLNNRYSTLIGAFVTAGLIPAVIEIPFSLTTGDTPSTMQYIVLLLAEYLIMLIGQVLSTGVVLVHLNMTRNKEYKVSQIFQPLKNGAERYFGAAFLLSILSILCCLPLILGGIYYYYAKTDVLSVFILAGTAILTIILALRLILNYNFVSFLLLDYPQMKVLSAFKECRLMMRKNKGRLLYIMFSFCGWGFLILCSLGIAALWVSPYMTQTLVIFYLDCTKELDQIPVRDYSKPDCFMI